MISKTTNALINAHCTIIIIGLSFCFPKDVIAIRVWEFVCPFEGNTQELAILIPTLKNANHYNITMLAPQLPVSSTRRACTGPNLQ